MTSESEFPKRISNMMREGFLCLQVALGNRLRLFDELEKASKINGVNSTELAAALGYKERYVREWLSAVATGDIIDVADGDDRYYLTPEKGKALSLSSGATPALWAWMLPVCAGAYRDIVEAFKADGPLGVPYGRYPDFHPWRKQLTTFTFPTFVEKGLIPAAPQLWKAAESAEGIQVCEVGCSEGVLTSILATKYPNSNFWASDIGQSEIDKANKLKLERKLDNVTYEVQDVTRLPKEWNEKFDAVIIYDVIHDLGQPNIAVKELHRVLKKGGSAVITDIGLDTSVRDNMQKPEAALIYSVSLFHCMPVSLNCGPDAWGLGAGWGKQRAEALFKESGFEEVATISYEEDIVQAIYVCKK